MIETVFIRTSLAVQMILIAFRVPAKMQTVGDGFNFLGAASRKIPRSSESFTVRTRKRIIYIIL